MVQKQIPGMYIVYHVMVPLLFYLAFYSIDRVSADFEGHSGLLKRYLCGDIQGIYILQVFVYEVVVPWYITYCTRVPLVFLLAFYSMD